MQLQLRNIGVEKCRPIVCPNNLAVGRATALPVRPLRLRPWELGKVEKGTVKKTSLSAARTARRRRDMSFQTRAGSGDRDSTSVRDYVSSILISKKNATKRQRFEFQSVRLRITIVFWWRYFETKEIK